jgi:hypothetical protein
MTSVACIYAVNSIRVLHGKHPASEYQCLNDFKLPRPPKLTPAERSMIMSDQILTPHADKMHLSKEETDHLLGICNKFPNLWSIHPYEIREANNIPEKMIRKQGSKIANARPYCLSQYETVHMGYHISLLLESGVIERSTSAYNSPTLVVLKANPKQYLQESEIPGAASITNSLSAIKELVLKKTCGETDHMKGLWLSKVRFKNLYPCKCKSKQKCICQAQPKEDEATKQLDAVSDTEDSAPDVKTETTEGADANLIEDNDVKAESQAIAGPSTATEDTTLATEVKGECQTPPGQLTAGDLSTDHQLIDDEFPGAEENITLTDWRNDSQASQPVNDFVNNKRFLFTKVSKFFLDCSEVNATCVDADSWPEEVSTLTNALDGMVIACKLDLGSAYHNLILDEDSRDLTSFKTPFGKYRYTRLAMGFKNAPHMLRRYLSTLVGDLPTIILYYDDILLMSKSKEEMFTLLETVLDRLDKGGLSINPRKFILFCSRVGFLGSEVILMDQRAYVVE